MGGVVATDCLLCFIVLSVVLDSAHCVPLKNYCCSFYCCVFTAKLITPLCTPAAAAAGSFKEGLLCLCVYVYERNTLSK